MKNLIKIAAAALVSIVSVNTALADFSGGYNYFNDGLDYLVLGDSDDDTYAWYEGTPESCGHRGEPYYEMREALRGESYVNWEPVSFCHDNLEHICIEGGDTGYTSCSTYRFIGWSSSNVWFDEI